MSGDATMGAERRPDAQGPLWEVFTQGEMSAWRMMWVSGMSYSSRIGRRYSTAERMASSLKGVV
jgi:hypothetical protein